MSASASVVLISSDVSVTVSVVSVGLWSVLVGIAALSL